MEKKKSDEANIENLRVPIRLIGLLFIGSLVLASFSYTSAVEREDSGKKEKKSTAIKFQQEEKKEDTPPPPTPPQVDVPPPPQEEIVEKKNTEKEPEVVVVITPPDLPKGPETKVEVKEEIIDFPDVEASFPGGAAEMQKWINQNVRYPQMAIENNEQGKVYLSFVVEPNGEITNVVIERGVSTDLDREAKRLVREMPKWVPGEANGRKVRARFRMPINFTLN